MSEHINLETDKNLRAAAIEFNEQVDCTTRFVPEVGSFALAYLGEPIPKVRTWISMDTPYRLAISSRAAIPSEPLVDRFFLNIDMSPDCPAAIVRPGTINEGIQSRPVVRLLTSGEGLALAEDLRKITKYASSL